MTFSDERGFFDAVKKSEPSQKMSYLKIGNDSFLARLKIVRRAYTKSDGVYANEKIEKYLKTSIYEDKKVLKAAVKYLMEVIEGAAPMHDGVHIKISTTVDSPIPGTSQIGKIIEMMNNDNMLKISATFKLALRKYIHNEICMLITALSNKTGIPILESCNRDCGIMVRYNNYYVFTIWWDENFHVTVDDAFTNVDKVPVNKS